MSDKPPFDPNAAFSTSPVDAKPAFNPSAPFTTAAPQELPDVGPPAISYGQEELSPGLPSVNAAADTLAKSANKNIIEPIIHPIDTLKGVGSVGLGAGQYAGIFPGDEFKPSVDALAADYAKTYGSVPGFTEALKNDPVRVAMDASMGLGLISKLGRAGGIGRPVPRVEAPSIEALHDAAEGHYNAMHGFGVELHPRLPADVATNIETELKTVGYRPRLAPKTFDIIDELRNPDGPYMTTQEIEGTRRALNKAAADPLERDAARLAIGHIDDMMANLTPADAAINPHFAPRVSQEALQARGDYAAMKRAEQIEGATRQKFRAILASPKQRRGFSPEELDQMEGIVRGSFTGNAVRLVGKLAPTGVVSGALSAGLGHVAGHTLGVPAIGAAAKIGADAATRRAAARLSEQVRLRSPEARRLGSVQSPPLTPAIARGVARGSQYERMLNPNGEQ